ncbi:MAG: hypothetical protein Q7R60_00060 [bacterium]|nr:hypothetical protein [bacterium]
MTLRLYCNAMINRRLLIIKLLLGLLLIPLLSLPAQAQKSTLTADEIKVLLQTQAAAKKNLTAAEYKTLLNKLTPEQSLTLIKNLTPTQEVIAQIDKLTTAQKSALTQTRAETIINNLTPAQAQNLVQTLAPANTAPGIADPNALDPGKDLWQTVNKLIRDIRSWLIPIAVLIIIYAGILYETSALNPALQGTAKTILWTTIFGLIFMILYPTIVGILSDQKLIPETKIDTTGDAGS